MKTFFLKSLFCVSTLLSVWPPLGAQSHFEKHFFGHSISKDGHILALPNGNFATAYTSEGYAIVSLFDECGHSLWNKKLFAAAHFSESLGFYYQGNRLWLGATLGPRFPDSALAVAALDLSGNLVREFVLESTAEYYWYKFHVAAQGDLIFTGNSLSTSVPSNAVLRVSPTGQVLQHRQYLSNFIWGMSTITADGGVLNTSGNYVYKLNPKGDIEWIHQFTGSRQHLVQPITGPDGYYIFSQESSNHTQVFKLSLQGQMVWQTPALKTQVSAASLDANNQLYLTGSYFDNTGQSGVSLIRINEKGELAEGRKLPSPQGSSTNYDLCAVQGNLLLLSEKNGPNGDGIVVQRIPPSISSAYPCKGDAFLPDVLANPIASIPNIPTQPKEDFFNFTSKMTNFGNDDVLFTEQSFCQSTKPWDIDLGADTSLCPGEILSLSPDSLPPGEFLWNTGSRGQNLVVQEPGIYWLKVENSCDGRIWQDTVVVNYFAQQELKTEYTPNRPALGDRVTFSNPINQAVFWAFPNGDTLQGTQVSIEIDKPGPFTITQFWITQNGCLIKDSLTLQIATPELHMPDAFTPNGDGLNDIFEVKAGALDWYEMEIYDRFGGRVSHTENAGWDGKIGHKAAPPGVYVVIIHYKVYEGQSVKMYTGSLTLLR